MGAEAREIEALGAEHVRAWLKQSAALVFLGELRASQGASVAAILRASTDDTSTLAAVRIAQGAELTIGYIEARIEDARAKKENEDERGD